MKGAGYYTLKSAAEARLTEKRSVFLGSASPVKSEGEALEFLNSVRKKYSDATHNVYAYIVRSGNLSRFSDDGEPHGTAGLPVLGVLRKEELCDCAVVVTRYFGGILLGAGGLVRAYTAAAKAAVDAAVKVFMKPFDIVQMRFGYDRYDRLLRLFQNLGVSVSDSAFTSEVSLMCRVPQEKTDAFLSAVREATNAAAETRFRGVEYGYEDDK